MRVAAVIVTRNRSEALCDALAAVARQTRTPDAVYVVDNASTDDTPDFVRRDHPQAVYLQLSENTGSGPGLSAGMRAAHHDGFDAFWLLDDDSQARPDALHLEGCALRQRPQPVSGAFKVDFVLLDGALVRRAMVDAVGVPRGDFFMMMGDVEYPFRARRAGLDVLCFEHDLIDRRLSGLDRLAAGLAGLLPVAQSPALGTRSAFAGAARRLGSPSSPVHPCGAAFT